MKLPTDLFRADSLREHLEPSSESSLLHLQPVWTKRASWTLLAAFAAALFVLTIARVGDYATGPAVIQVPSMEVLSTNRGRVSRVLVDRNSHVNEGDVLVELDVTGELDQRNQLEQEFRRQLAAQMLNPLDPEVTKQVAALRSQLELSDASLRQRSIRAPHDGVVTDIRIRTGDMIDVGTSSMSLRPSNQKSVVIALLPGRFRPMLATGQILRLEINGFPYEFQELRLTHIGDTLVGPREIQRFLGPSLGDAFNVEGPSIVAAAELRRPSFQSHGQRYEYYAGMPATARVRVRTRSGWSIVLPVLEYLR